MNQELRIMQAFAPDYDRLPLIAKVEAFEHALQSTEGNDLARVNSERHLIIYVYFQLFIHV